MAKRILFFVAIAVLFCSCEADKINYSSDIRLSFSTEKVFFDTIFTAQGSATKKIKIYNTSKNKVLMSKVNLAVGDAFMVNLDGKKGTGFSDVIINAKDSMIAFIQVNINPTDERTPFIVEDSIRFLVNGNEQFVRLEAYGRNAKRFNNYKFTADTVITDAISILVKDTLTVPEGVTLTIKEGATVYFRKGAMMMVGGSLKIEGGQQSFVTLRGDRNDFMNTEPPLNYDNASNQWGGVRFTSTSTGNSLSFANIRNSSFGLIVDSLVTAAGALTIENCCICNSGTNLVTATNADVKISNSLLYSAGGNILNFTGGDIDVTHCTIANYYNYTWGGRTAANVYITNTTVRGTEIPVDASFVNTIVYGSFKNEIVIDQPTCTYFFQNCLVRQSVPDGDEHYVDCIFKSPQFIYESWTEEYKKSHPHLYDFHLQETSPAIGNANYAVSQLWPSDLDGKNRISSEVSDIGCYSFK